MNYLRVILLVNLSVCVRAAARRHAGCHHGHNKRFIDTMEKSRCMPRETIVDLPQPASDILVLPNKVAVMRCDGFCPDLSTTCQPTKTRETKVVVRMKDIVTGKELCDYVPLTEHLECKCQQNT